MNGWFIFGMIMVGWFGQPEGQTRWYQWVCWAVVVSAIAAAGLIEMALR